MSVLDIEKNLYEKFPVIDLGNGYILRQPAMNDGDIESIYKIYNDPKITIFVPDDCIPRGMEGAKDEVRYYANAYLFRTAIYWFVAEKSTNKAIGTCGFPKWDRYNARLELAYNLMSEYHNKGIMTGVLKEVVNFGFHTLKVRRIEAQLDPTNVASIHVLEKNGFSKDGILPSYRYYKYGKHVDVLMMSIINNNYVR